MVIIKHTGNGQTLCCGCLAAGKQPIHWDSWITEIQYDSGEKLGSFCYECFRNAAKYLRIEVK